MGSLTEILSNYAVFLQENWTNVAIYLAVVVVWLWSGCWSGSIAENRLRSPWTHFFMGLGFPIIYPIVILFQLPVYKSRIVKEEAAKVQHLKVEGPPPVEAAPPVLEDSAPGMVDTAMLDSPEIGYDQRFFKQMAVDMSGNYRGPFEFVINGDKLKVERIVDALPDNVLIEFVSPDGKIQSIRVPYRNIESCSEL